MTAPVTQLEYRQGVEDCLDDLESRDAMSDHYRAKHWTPEKETTNAR